jgi:hypothetical protein
MERGSFRSSICPARFRPRTSIRTWRDVRDLKGVCSHWNVSGAFVRWRLGFVYCLAHSGQSDEFAIPVVTTVTVKGSRLPGAPVRSQPGPGGCKLCALWWSSYAFGRRPHFRLLYICEVDYSACPQAGLVSRLNCLRVLPPTRPITAQLDTSDANAVCSCTRHGHFAGGMHAPEPWLAPGQERTAAAPGSAVCDRTWRRGGISNTPAIGTRPFRSSGHSAARSRCDCAGASSRSDRTRRIFAVPIGLWHR